MTAKVLAPITITPAMVTACSVSEPDTSTGETVWSAATTYAIGNTAIRATTHRVYTALAAGADAGLPEVTPLRWKDTGPTNKYAAFDIYRSTAITQAGTLTMTVKPGVITDMAFFGLQGDSLRVVCSPAAGGVAYYDKTFSLATYLTGDLMWEFYFGTPRQQDGLRVTGLYPQDAQVSITLTVSAITGVAAIGIWAMGSFNSLGGPQYGFKAQPVDYSRITTDAYGTVTIAKGLAAKNLAGDCMMAATDAQATADVVYRLLSIPCAWVMSEDPAYDYLSAFGLGSADITAAGPSHALLTLTVRGIV